MTESVWPAKPQIFTNLPITGRVHHSLYNAFINVINILIIISHTSLFLQLKVICGRYFHFVTYYYELLIHNRILFIIVSYY